MTTKKEVPVVRAHSLTRRGALRVGEAIDGHTELAIGWQTARHPEAIEARADAHQRDVDSYLAEVLAGYAAK